MAGLSVSRNPKSTVSAVMPLQETTHGHTESNINVMNVTSESSELPPGSQRKDFENSA